MYPRRSKARVLQPVRRRVVHPAATTGQTVSPAGVASTEAFGTAVITPGPVTLSPTGVGSSEAFGTLQVNQTIYPVGISTGEAFGTVQLNLNVAPVGIASGGAFGVAVVTPGGVTVSPAGVVSGEAFGTAVITLTGNQTIAVSGIVSREAFGVPSVWRGIPPVIVPAVRKRYYVTSRTKFSVRRLIK